jgi:hypothetical protein
MHSGNLRHLDIITPKSITTGELLTQIPLFAFVLTHFSHSGLFSYVRKDIATLLLTDSAIP